MRLPTQIFLLGASLALSTHAAEPAYGSTSTATAAPPDVVTLEPVRVTADLWESPLATISASVTVLDRPAIRETGARHFSDLADQVPNLTWTGATSRPRYFQIRGIGENSQYEGETPDSSVRFLVDDFDVTGLGTLAGTFDVAQIEVLRGPQAGAFGANAAGGIIRLVTNAPTPYATGELSGSVGNNALREGGFAVGGPVLKNSPETLMFRFALHHAYDDGFRKNVTLGRETNARDELISRLRLTWNPGESWRWEGALLFSEVDNGFDEFALDNNGRLTFSDEPGRDAQRTRGATLRGVYDGWQETRITSVTSIVTADSVYSYDSDWTAASYQGFIEQRRDRATLSQEIRLDGETDGFVSRWTVGAYGQRLAEDGDYFYRDPGYREDMGYDYRLKNVAIFGQAAHALDARARLVLGLRMERVWARAESVFADNFGGTAAFSPTFDDTLFGGKLTYERDLSENLLSFVSVARGYKAGGVNVDTRINPGAGDPLIYDTETLWNYEAGLRGSAPKRGLTSEVVAFYLDRRDAQVRDSAGFGGNYRFFTDNADRAYTYGLESSATWRFADAWTLRGSLGLMDSHLDRFTLSNGNVGGGRRLANTPTYSYSLGLRYRDLAGWFGSAEIVGRDEVYDSNNQNENRSAFEVVNLALGREFGSWTVTAWCRNAFDEAYEKRVFFFNNGFGQQRYETRADPRTFGLSAVYRF